MKISGIELINFKRFTDLKVTNIPISSKLVVIIGSNGSGKSSLFDSFGFLDAPIKQDVYPDKEFFDYYKKDKANPVKVSLQFDGDATFDISSDKYEYPRSVRTTSLRLIFPNLSQFAFYGRTSFRQIPRLTRTSLGQGGLLNFEKDSDRPKYFIDKDNRFENDIEKVTEIILKDFFRSGQSNDQIRHKYIDPINDALKNIFGEGNGTKLQLIEIIPPLEGKVAQITFRKGKSEIHYNYLSAGEKEVFNLLINLLSRRELYQDTIYFFDEIDLHLNTKLQFNLLKEVIENWIPENCQLWTATHSLGFIEYARKSDHASLLDLDDLDFDFPQILSPVPKDDPDVYEIAVGKEFLHSLFQQMNIYFVENKDRDYYASIGIPNTVFISENNRNSVYHKVRSTDLKGLVDRDFLSDDDIVQIRVHYPKLFILNYYSIENYMYHPDNLEEYFASCYKDFNKNEYIEQLTAAKNQVKDSILLKVTLSRSGYPFFGEPEYNGSPFQKRFRNEGENGVQSEAILGYLNSNDLETFYKSLPMKTYCTNLKDRQNISKTDLVKTEWFKGKIVALLI